MFLNFIKLSIFILFLSVNTVQAANESESGFGSLVKTMAILIVFIPVFMLCFRMNDFVLVLIIVVILMFTLVVAEDVEFENDCTVENGKIRCTESQLASLQQSLAKFKKRSKLMQDYVSCDSGGYCITNSNEIEQMQIDDCYALGVLSLKQIFCAVVGNSKSCVFKDKENQQMMRLPFCIELREEDYELDHSDEVWLRRIVNNILAKETKTKKRNAIVRMVDELKVRIGSGRLEDLLKFKIIYERLASMVPSAIGLFEEQYLNGKISTQTVQAFNEEVDTDFGYGTILYLINKKKWSGFSLQKILLVLIIALVLYLVLMLNGPKAFRQFLGTFAIIAFLVLCLVLMM